VVDLTLLMRQREAPAKLYLASTFEFEEPPETPFKTTEEACAAAAEAAQRGEHLQVRVWSEGHGFIEELDALTLHDLWSRSTPASAGNEVNP
jgi:hypothetical protein